MYNYVLLHLLTYYSYIKILCYFLAVWRFFRPRNPIPLLPCYWAGINHNRTWLNELQRSWQRVDVPRGMLSGFSAAEGSQEAFPHSVCVWDVVDCCSCPSCSAQDISSGRTWISSLVKHSCDGCSAPSLLCCLHTSSKALWVRKRKGKKPNSPGEGWSSSGQRSQLFCSRAFTPETVTLVPQSFPFQNIIINFTEFFSHKESNSRVEPEEVQTRRKTCMQSPARERKRCRQQHQSF